MNKTNTHMTLNNRTISFFFAAFVACLFVTALPSAVHAQATGGADYTIGGADYTIGGGQDFIIGNDTSGSYSGGCFYCGGNYTIGNGADYTIGNGADYTIGNGADYTFGNGANYTIGNGADYTIGNGADYTIGNGADYTIGNGADYTIGNGADYTIGNGADYTIGNGADYTTGGLTYETGGYTYNTGGYVPAASYGINTGYYGGGYYGGSGYYGGGYSVTTPSYVINTCGTNCYNPNPVINCPTGYTLQNGVCVPPTQCPSGFTLQNGVCVPPNQQCPSGWTQASNGSCVPPRVNCPTGYTQDQTTGACIPPQGQCPSGYTLQNGVCIPPQGQCPSGWTMNNNVCVPPSGSCPAGYTMVNGTCTPPTGSCPSGYTLQGGICVPPNGGCPSGYVMNGGVCVPPYYPPNYPTYPYPSYPSYPIYPNNATCNIYVQHNYNSWGTPVTISWTSQNASGGTISYIGSVGPSGSTTVYPTQAYTYVGTFYGYNGQIITCSATVGRTSNAPYVSLSQVPYTGLDLGPVGEVFYWAFLILWSLWVAYLVVVKKIYKTATAYAMHFLFGKPMATAGTAHTAVAHTTKVAHATHATTTVAPAPAATHVDDFILSQINRSSK